MADIVSLNAVFGYFAAGIVYIPTVWAISRKVSSIENSTEKTAVKIGAIDDKITLQLGPVKDTIKDHNDRIVFLEQQKMERQKNERN